MAAVETERILYIFLKNFHTYSLSVTVRNSVHLLVFDGSSEIGGIFLFRIFSFAVMGTGNGSKYRPRIQLGADREIQDKDTTKTGCWVSLS